MSNFQIDQTNTTPSISGSRETSSFEIRGKCYPEDTPKFFNPFIFWLKEYLAIDASELTATFDIQYFNSSSSKFFFDIFDMLDEARQNGHKIIINWEYAAENESSQEAGEDFIEDFEAMTINLVVKGQTL
ncbi:MAG: DUF1987 domain-containing protein [SAR324 cluster bacterium]|nr:DUF1987 domain-containing protein [SAR324 cluster bacterium]